MKFYYYTYAGSACNFLRWNILSILHCESVCSTLKGKNKSFFQSSAVIFGSKAFIGKE